VNEAPVEVAPLATTEDVSNMDEVVPEATDATANIEDPLESIPASRTKDSQSTTQLEPEVDFVAPPEEEAPAIIQAEAENLLPRTEREDAISHSPDETIIIPEDAATSVTNVEERIVEPVDVQSEHATMFETSRTEEHAEVIPSPNVEESPEKLIPPVEPLYKIPDEIVEVGVPLISGQPQKLNSTPCRVISILKWMPPYLKPKFIVRPRLCRLRKSLPPP
jgi:hypothetical protein